MPSPTEITVTQLNRLIGTSGVPIIIDVSIDEDFEADPNLIPTAFRHSFQEIEGLASALEGRKTVVVCQKGKKLSQGAAAILRDCGVHAETLQGGNYGWRDAELPRVPANKLPKLNKAGRTVWVTRQRPKIDRIACPWLIRRFVDPNAQFLFVGASEVADVAGKYDATPFDIEGVFWSHREDLCTFDVMVEEFALEIPALHHLARIVRGADTDRLDLEPQCAGLMAASLGLSRMYRDDLAQLNAGMALYDAFYRWARDAVDEGHDWPAASKKG